MAGRQVRILKSFGPCTSSSLFPQIFFFLKCSVEPSEKVSAQCKFKMAMEQPTLVSFDLKRLSNDQDRPLSSISGDRCVWAPKNNFNEIRSAD